MFFVSNFPSQPSQAALDHGYPTTYDAGMKKPMTVDELADLIISTMASKEDVAQFKGDVDKRFEEIDKRFEGVDIRLGEIAERIDDLQIDVNKIHGQLSKVDNYKILQLEVTKLLRDKKVIT